MKSTTFALIFLLGNSQYKRNIRPITITRNLIYVRLQWLNIGEVSGCSR